MGRELLLVFMLLYITATLLFSGPPIVQTATLAKPETAISKTALPLSR